MVSISKWKRSYDQQIGGLDRVKLLCASIGLNGSDLVCVLLARRVSYRIGPLQRLGRVLHQHLVLGEELGVRVFERKTHLQRKQLHLRQRRTNKDHLNL